MDYILQMQIESYLSKIEKIFKPDCRITLIVRKPDNNEADVVLTRDNLDDVISVIERTKQRSISCGNKTESQ